MGHRNVVDDREFNRLPYLHGHLPFSYHFDAVLQYMIIFECLYATQMMPTYKPGEA